MALNFPTSPATNDEYTFETKTWVWNGTVWALKQDSPTVLLDLIKTVDGAGSGLEADNSVTVTDGVYLNSTQTITNKRIQPRVQLVTSASTLTPDADSADVCIMDSLAVALTINLPTGTPTNGQRLIIRIEDNGTSRALTWSGYRAVGVTLPTTTVASKILYVGVIYNSQDSTWDAIAVAQLL